MNSSKQIKFGAVLSYVAIVVNIASGLLYTPWMVDTIGKSQYGLYTLANSLITLFLVDFGLSAATSRYLSKYNAEGDRDGAERFLGAVYKLYLLIDAVILCALTVTFFFLESIYVNLTTAELEQFKVVYVICALFSVINFPFVTLNGILTAYEKFVQLKIADLLYRFCNIGFTVVALFLGYGLYALVTVHAFVGLIILIFKYIVIQRIVPIKINFKSREKGIYKEIFGFSVWATVSGVMKRLVFNITPSILGIVAGSGAIAVFGIVNTIEGYAYTITSAIRGMFMPKVARIMTKDQAKHNLNQLLISVGRFQFALNGLIVVGFAVVGRSFINLWMGQEYSQAYGGILMVMIPGLFHNAMQIADTTMIVENKVKLSAGIHIVTGVVNVALSFLFSTHFGVIGACASICVAYMIRDVLQHIICHKVLPLDIPAFMKACYGRMSVPILLTLGCGAVINMVIADGGWMILAVKGMLVVCVYLLLVYLLGLKKEERKSVAARLKKKLT